MAVPRNLITSLGPPVFGAAEPAPVNPAPAAAAGGGERPAMSRLARVAVCGMGVAGVLPPLAFTARPGELGLIGGVPVSIALTGVLILAPALVGLVAALSGLDGMREVFHARGDREHEQAVLRVFVAVLAVVYGFAAAVFPAYGDDAARCQIVAALGLAGGWVLLLLSLIDAVPSAPRHYLGTVFDAVLISAFLHYGGALAAPWLPLYLIAAFYAGFRFGLVALAAAALADLAGFAGVVATTPFWREQGLLAGGFGAAMIVLPAYVGRMIREVAASREAAVAAQAARTRFLMVVSQALRAPLDALLGEKAAPQAPPGTSAGAPMARALLSQLNSVLDFSAIEAGAFAPPVEAFDLHRLVNATMAERQAEAKARGLQLRVNIDPAMPYRLRGWAQQLAQILDYIVARALEVSEAGAVRVAVDAAGGTGRTLHLRVAVHDDGRPIAVSDADAIFDPFAPQPSRSAHGAFGLAVVKRLVELMGGRIAVESRAAQGSTLTVTVPIAVDDQAVDRDLDLQRCLVLIATEDSQFASELAEPLNAWRGDPRWIEGFGGTLGFVEGREAACSVLIVDSRRHALAALSFAHRSVSGPAPPSFVLAVAEAAQIDGLLDLADGEIDAVLPAPLDVQLFANALHSLPLWQGASPRPVMVPAADLSAEEPAAIFEPPPPPPPAEAAPAETPAGEPQVTPISAHPRFAGETPIVDPRAIAALRGLGEGDFFFGEVVDSFRTDVKEIMHRIVRSAAAADAGSFARGLHALRSCAGNLGGMRLCEMLLSLREVGEQELREQGSVLVQRLGDELARLDAALAEYLAGRGTRREA
jgi:two-component system, sensor histidine kinase RpfC